MNADSISLIVPARNEGNRLKTFLSDLMIQAARLTRISQVVVVLDACTDESAQIVREMALIWPPGCTLTAVEVEPSQGKAHAVWCGLAAAPGHFALLWDADLEYGLCALPALVDAASTWTLVSGRRQAGMGWKSWLANALVRLTLRLRGYGRPPADVLTGVHLAEAAWLRSTLHAVQPGGYTLEATLVREALRSRLYCYDVPVAYRPRSIAEGRGVRWYHLPSILRAAA